jgi:hypothetical protein
LILGVARGAVGTLHMIASNICANLALAFSAAIGSVFNNTFFDGLRLNIEGKGKRRREINS